MIELYSTSYYNKIKEKKRKLLTSYFIVLGLFLAVIIAIMITYANEPYGTKLRTPFLVALIVISIVFVVYSFIFFSITYGRLKKYEYYLYFTVFGKHEVIKATVIDVNNSTKDVGGVDFYSFTALVWSDIQNDYVERLIYVDCELNFDVNVNDVLTIKVNSSYLVGYER